MNLIEETLLFESRMSEAKKKFGNLNMYDWQLLDNLDPSDNHKYLMWLAREYDKGNISAEPSPKVEETLNFMQLTSQMGPQGQVFLKQDKLIDYIADQMGIPAELRTTPEERQELMEQAMQVAQQAQEQGLINGQPEQPAEVNQ